MSGPLALVREQAWYQRRLEDAPTRLSRAIADHQAILADLEVRADAERRVLQELFCRRSDARRVRKDGCLP